MNATLPANKLYRSPITDFLLDAVCLESPVVRETIAAFGGSSLSQYLDNAVQVVNDPLQPRGDMMDAIYRYVQPLLGEVVAKRVCGEVEISPVALTTNHHGVDFFAQSVQGSLIFSQRVIDGRRARTVPVFACGGIPLDNLTYPQGLLLYGAGNGQLDSIPRKLPVFSNRLRRQTTCLAGPIEQAMIERARGRASQMAREQHISPPLLIALDQIFKDDYASPEVARLSSYSEQAVVLNSRIWKRLFADPRQAPDLVYLELEKLTTALLERDLLNADSLASCVMLDAQCRQSVVDGLEGAMACWQEPKLRERLAGYPGKNTAMVSKNHGTMFFWGVNDHNRKVPLCLVNEGAGDMLRGNDDKARQFECPFEPEALVDGLREKKLLPSLFTAFLTLALARGMNCLGGYYQAQYLPAIQRGLVNALRNRGGHDDVADRVEQVHTTGYLGGMQAVALRLQHGRMGPAGPAEISASGGLSADDLEQIQSCTVRDVHIASLFETIPDLGLSHLAPSNWKSELALDCDAELSGKVVFKSLGTCGHGHEENVFSAQNCEVRDRPVSSDVSSILDEEVQQTL